MIDPEIVAASLAPVRDLLRPDGADIEFVDVDEDVALLRLMLESAQCTDVCVMPRKLLETLALQMMQPQVPGLAAVSIKDPRETET